MKKLIFILSIILLAILFNFKPAYITINEQQTDTCTIDMAKNQGLICD